VRAAVITALTGPDAIEIRDVPEPEPALGRVRVDVHYAGVVFPDVLQTRGEYQVRPDLPFSPGWEVAGVVREDAGGFRAGDRVAAMPVTGGFAETVAIDTEMVFPLPSSVSFHKGAAIPLNYLTVDFALLRRARLIEGETVLVHGAAGGIGTTFRTRTLEEKARVVAELCVGVDLVGAAGRLRPIVDRVLPWTSALQAQDALAAGEYVGKIVLEVA
jgi:NADPH2:quinone reductase